MRRGAMLSYMFFLGELELCIHLSYTYIYRYRYILRQYVKRGFLSIDARLEIHTIMILSSDPIMIQNRIHLARHCHDMMAAVDIDRYLSIEIEIDRRC